MTLQSQVTSQYIGFEPSGRPHIGILPILLNMPARHTIFWVANWHAQINGKEIYPEFSSTLDKIVSRVAATRGFTCEVVEAGPEYLREIADLELEVSKLLTTNRVQKALTITGKEFKGSERMAILRYITLQVADPFFLGVQHILSGADQRSCSVLTLEVAKKMGKPMTFETFPLMLNTKASTSNMTKMSKSAPDTCISLDEEWDSIWNKLNTATPLFLSQCAEMLGCHIYDDYKLNIGSIVRVLEQVIY